MAQGRHLLIHLSEALQHQDQIHRREFAVGSPFQAGAAQTESLRCLLRGQGFCGPAGPRSSDGQAQIFCTKQKSRRPNNDAREAAGQEKIISNIDKGSETPDRGFRFWPASEPIATQEVSVEIMQRISGDS